MSRYVTGDNVDLLAQRGEGKEWERNTDLSYVFQSGAAEEPRGEVAQRDLAFQLRQRHRRNRLIVSYTLPLW
ncbi:OprD family outer membrane porin [Pseudomonas aeruginosa]